MILDKIRVFTNSRKQQKIYTTKQHGRSMLEMLAVLAIIGVLSITALVGFTYAMNKHRANETIYDVMLRGTNVPMIDENYYSKPSGYEFLFPGLGQDSGRQGVYYPMSTKKDSGSSYYVEATGVSYRVCELILKMEPTDIDQIVVNNSVYQGDSDICGSTDGLAMRFCFGSDGTICNGTGTGGGTSSGSGTGSGSGSGSAGTDLCENVTCMGCQKCDPSDGICKDDDGKCLYGQICLDGICTCSDNTQCPEGEICQDGSCVKPECITDDDCDYPKICVDNQCVCPNVGAPTECQEIVYTAQSDCPMLQNKENGTQCTTDAGYSGKCYDGVCIDIRCPDPEYPQWTQYLGNESSGLCCKWFETAATNNSQYQSRGCCTDGREAKLIDSVNYGRLSVCCNPEEEAFYSDVASYNSLRLGCCPAGMVVIHNGGKSKCCMPGSTYDTCCQPDAPQYTLSPDDTKTAFCCQPGQTAANSLLSGVVEKGCCPDGREAVVAPNGYVGKYGVSFCCPIGYKGYHNTSNSGCCPPDRNYRVETDGSNWSRSYCD